MTVEERKAKQRARREEKAAEPAWRSFTIEEQEQIRKEKEEEALRNPPKPPPKLAPEIKEAGIAEYRKLYTSPFKYVHGTIVDGNDNMVLQIRGWGRIQHSKAKNVTPEQIQDSFGEIVAELLDKWYSAERSEQSLFEKLLRNGWELRHQEGLARVRSLVDTFESSWYGEDIYQPGEGMMPNFKREVFPEFSQLEEHLESGMEDHP